MKRKTSNLIGIPENLDDISIFLATEKEKISLGKSINKSQSKFIFNIIKGNKPAVQINWSKVMSNFECTDGNNEQLEKKIRDHVYNQTAKQKRQLKIRENYKKKYPITSLFHSTNNN